VTGKTSFDVAIVGAGPAGAWAALRLARAGARVVIIDGSHPREKPCGGGLSARALNLLRQLPACHLLNAVDVTAARFSTSSVTAAVPLALVDGQTPALVITSRREFDGALLRAATDAGADHLDRRAVAFERVNGGWNISTDTHRAAASWLIGADGANSLVRRRIFEAFRRSDLSIGSGYFIGGQSGTQIDIEFTETPRGYLWSFPRPDHLAIGVCGQADETASAELFEASDRWIKSRYKAVQSDLTRYSWPIPSLSERALLGENSSSDRCLLIGDAAGLVDPITREGIYYALQSAELAAGALRGENAAISYSRAIRNTIHRELRKAARMKRRFFHPSFNTLLVRSLQRSERISAIMAGLVSGQLTYEGLRRRLLLTGEIRLAIEYLKLST
jgi:geranylgeranyl diphosphate/geranylgeranyl-bacteriochlorophyllide a reductase